jgi:uncharacterized protein
VPGVDRNTGKWLGGWAHVVQSIGVIVSTAIGTRVQRRQFGTEEAPLIDRPITESEVLHAIMAIAVALDKWEPRFRLVRCVIKDANEMGKLVLQIAGVYYPRGHLGDFSEATERDFEVAA